MPTDNEVLDNELIRAVEILAEVFAAKPIRYALVGGSPRCALSASAVANSGMASGLNRIGRRRNSHSSMRFTPRRNGKQVRRESQLSSHLQPNEHVHAVDP